MAARQNSTKPAFFGLKGRTMHVFGRSVTLPASRMARIAIGVLLLIGGCLAFLPVLGVWMLPLGFMVLSIDIAFVRRMRRRSDVRWRRWRAAHRVLAERRTAAASSAVDVRR